MALCGCRKPGRGCRRIATDRHAAERIPPLASSSHRCASPVSCTCLRYMLRHADAPDRYGNLSAGNRSGEKTAAKIWQQPACRARATDCVEGCLLCQRTVGGGQRRRRPTGGGRERAATGLTFSRGGEAERPHRHPTDRMHAGV
jgi:hypothetical protein